MPNTYSAIVRPPPLLPITLSGNPSDRHPLSVTQGAEQDAEAEVIYLSI